MFFLKDNLNVIFLSMMTAVVILVRNFVYSTIAVVTIFFLKGGPLMIKDLKDDHGPYYIAGILSYGAADCGSASVPSVYTKVADYLEWILDEIYWISTWSELPLKHTLRFYSFLTNLKKLDTNCFVIVCFQNTASRLYISLKLNKVLIFCCFTGYL